MIPSNPFCTRFVRPGAIRYRFPTHQNRTGENLSLLDDQAELQAICDRLQVDRIGLIVGPHGSGKSTLLQSLLPVLEPRYRKVLHLQLCDLRSGNPISRFQHARQNWRTIHLRFSQLGDRDLLIIDGVDQLPTLSRIGLLRRSKKRQSSILVTAHRPLYAVQVLFETKLDRQRIGELTAQLLQHSSIELAEIIKRKLVDLDYSHRTNLREFWFECYDDIQNHLRQTMES